MTIPLTLFLRRSCVEAHSEPKTNRLWVHPISIASSGMLFIGRSPQ